MELDERAARIDRALRGLVQPSSSSSATASSPSPASSARSSGSAGGTGSQDCRPWSREDMLARAQTFVPSRWFAPPRSLSPMVCARHGWHNSAVDTLGCSVCGHSITYAPDAGRGDGDNTMEEGEAASDTSFEAQLSTGHADDCSWRHEPCPRHFENFLHSDGGDALLDQFVTRLRALLVLPARGGAGALGHTGARARACTREKGREAVGMPQRGAVGRECEVGCGGGRRLSQRATAAAAAYSTACAAAGSGSIDRRAARLGSSGRGVRAGAHRCGCRRGRWQR
jgi:hypothetical protein